MKNWREMTVEEQQWGDACDKLMLQMLSSTFVYLFRGSRLISLAPAVVEVRDEGVKEMLELRWADRVAEALGVASVQFEVMKGETNV